LRGVYRGGVFRHTREQVPLVTGARPSRYDDIASRERRYLIRMAVRTVAVLVAVLAPLPLWARAIAIGLGLVLPWVSVTAANIGPLPEDRERAAAPTPMPSAPELPPAPDRRAS
jgi:hypothetical protein